MTEVVEIAYKPHEHQLIIHNSLKRFNVIVCHRRFGKTVMCINQLIHEALTHEGNVVGRFAYVAPYRTQAKKIAWDYLKNYSRPLNPKVNESELWIEFSNGSRITLFGADNPDAIRGVYLNGAVLDEMAFFKNDVWDAIIRPMLADYLGWAIFISTPKGINKFSELYYSALNKSDWYAGVFRADETNIIDAKELADIKAELSQNLYRQEMLCDFSASSEDVLINLDLVSNACNKSINESDLYGMPKIIGVDVARFGADRSVIQRRIGKLALEPIILTDVDNMHLAGVVAQTINEFKPDATFIDGGRGEGVIDRLRQLNYQVHEVQFGASAINPRYRNRRAEMWDLMKKWLEDGGAIPNNSSLKQDLCIPTYFFNPSNQFCLESKDDIKKRGMPSPDLADALALTFAMPVFTPDKGGIGLAKIHNIEPLNTRTNTGDRARYF